MAKAIELVGVSGVGKTAVYRRLRWKQFYLKNACTYRQAMCRAVTTGAGYKGPLRWLECQARAAFPVSLQSSAAGRFIEQNPGFSRSVWSLVSARDKGDAPGVGRAYRGLELFYRNFAHHQIVREYRRREYVLLDEGFVQRFKGFRAGVDHELRSSVQKYLSGLVNGVIFLAASAEEIEARAAGRTGSRRGDRDLSMPTHERVREIDNGLSEYREIISELEKEGVACWHVDASGSLEETVRRVVGVLGKL